MVRAEKIYARLDSLVVEFSELLIEEFKNDGYSPYFHVCLDEDIKGRTDNISGKRGGFEDANYMLTLEKEIRNLCLKLNEPLPFPLQVLDEYISSYHLTVAKKTPVPWIVKDAKGEHAFLQKQMIQKLKGNQNPTIADN